MFVFVDLVGMSSSDVKAVVSKNSVNENLVVLAIVSLKCMIFLFLIFFRRIIHDDSLIAANY